MNRILAGSALLVTSAALVSAQAQTQPPTLKPDPHHVSFQTQPARPLTLVPVLGTWTADYENANQILTIDGTAAAKPPVEAAIRDLMGPGAPTFQKALAAPGAFPLALARDLPNFQGGRLAVEFKLIGGATDMSAGIAFNIKPDGSYLFARYNTKDGNVAVWKFENGTRTVLTHGEAHEQLPLNQWHTLELQVGNGTVTASSAKGRLTVTHKLTGPVSGRAGVWTKPDSVTAFRHFHGNHGGHR